VLCVSKKHRVALSYMQHGEVLFSWPIKLVDYVFFFWLPSYSLWHFRVGRLLLAAHTHNAVHSTLSEIHILIGGTLIGLELEVGGLGNAK